MSLMTPELYTPAPPLYTAVNGLKPMHQPYRPAPPVHITTASTWLGVGNDPAWPEWGSAARTVREATWEGHQGELLHQVTGLDGVPYTVIRCRPCLLTHVVPLPSDDTLAAYYQQTFYQRSKTEMIHHYERDRAWWTWTHERILAAMRQALGRRGRQGSMVQFLDVGAGVGIALDVARQFGWYTVGIEPYRELSELVSRRGHDVFTGQWQDFVRAAPGPYWGDLFPVDLLYFYEVLEHVPNPEDALLWAYDNLVPGGVVAITVPNDYNPLQLQAQAQTGSAPWWLAPPEHLTYFTPLTLKLLVRRCGFELVELRGTFPMERFLLAGEWYIGNPTLGRQCHELRMRWELQHAQWPKLEQYYRDNLLQRREGREIVCLARKPATETR